MVKRGAWKRAMQGVLKAAARETRTLGGLRRRRVITGRVGASPVDLRDRLKALAARRRLHVVDERRLVWRLHEAGEGQQRIASLAGVSRAHVSRTIALLRDHPDLLETTPIELTRRATVGELPRDRMMKQLRTWSWTFGQVRGDAWETGSWDEMTQAVSEGTLTPDEYESIRRAAVRGRKARR